MPNRDEAIEIGIEHTQWMLRQRQAFRGQVIDWAKELGLKASETPTEWNPDEISFWFARVWMERVATDE